MSEFCFLKHVFYCIAAKLGIIFDMAKFLRRYFFIPPVVAWQSKGCAEVMLWRSRWVFLVQAPAPGRQAVRGLQVELIAEGDLENAVFRVAGIKGFGHAEVITAVENHVLVFVRQTHGDGEVYALGVRAVLIHAETGLYTELHASPGTTYTLAKTGTLI